MIITENASRLAIFFFYDKDGIADKYIEMLLGGVMPNCSRMVVVVNGKVNDAGKELFKKFTTEIIERENKGFDVWAYKEGLEYVGWDNLAKYDEVILMNYTMFGPMYPLEEMFSEMNKRDLDFWGVTKHHKVDFDCWNTCKYGYIPEHIQSNFLVIRNSLIKSKEYRNMWENMPMINSYGESVGLYEAVFTKEFNEMGFKSDVYVNTDDLEGYTRYPLMMMADELIKNRKCPFFKVKSFSQNYYDVLGDCVGNCTVDAFDFIKNNRNYDVDLIWQHILRTANMADIKHLMHLNYILPKNYEYNPRAPQKMKTAVMMHLYYEDLIDYCLNYAKSMPDGSDMIITVPNEKMKAAVSEKVKGLNFAKTVVKVIENVGRDVSSLLVGCAPYINDYDLVCFVHDKKTKQIKPYCNGESFSYKCFENNLASKEYVSNIINTFAENPRLGLLTPPPPNHGNFYEIVGSEWASNYESTLSLANKLGLNVNVHWTREPIAPLGTMFWFRPKAMKTLFDYGWKYSDFPKEPNAFDGTLLHAIERIYAFVVQHEGYYPAWVMTDKFAQIEITNLHFMLRELNLALLPKYYTNNLYDMTDKIKRHMKFVWTREIGFKALFKKIMPNKLWEFCKKIYYKVFPNKKIVQ